MPTVLIYRFLCYMCSSVTCICTLPNFTSAFLFYLWVASLLSKKQGAHRYKSVKYGKSIRKSLSQVRQIGGKENNASLPRKLPLRISSFVEALQFWNFTGITNQCYSTASESITAVIIVYFVSCSLFME